MHSTFQSRSHSKNCNLLCNPHFQTVAVVLLFVGAFLIRLHHLTSPPLDFVAIRQYQNAHIARGMFFDSLESVSEKRKEISRLNVKRMGFTLEPRITEQIAVWGYRIMDGEHLWIPRILSSLFWLIGGIFFYLTAIRILSSGAAVFSTFFYLFLPYGILASRSFQPDPLMEMMLLISIFTILWHHEKPSGNRLLIAAGASALAMFIKPYCVFLIFGAFISLSVNRHGVKKSVFNKNFVLFSFISLLPALVYYGYSSLMLVDAQDHIQGSFLPHLLLYPYFWKDWLTMIGQVVGYIAFAGSLLGLFMLSSQSRTLMTGLWIGYLIFGLLFTFHIHTHAYYQLQFIPVVALSLGPVASIICTRLSGILMSKRHTMILAATFIVLILCVLFIMRNAELKDYKNQLKIAGAFVGVPPQFYKFISSDFQQELKTAREIGEIVGHSTNNVFLTADFGRSLAYHGELSGLPWPISISLRDRKEVGIPIPDKEELFNTRYLTIRTHGQYIKYSPDFFIVTAFDEFEMQPDLKEFLNKNFPVLARGDDYLIFDLRKMAE